MTMDNNEWEKGWQDFLSTVVGHGTGIIGDVRPFIRKLLAARDAQHKEEIRKLIEEIPTDLEVADGTSDYLLKYKQQLRAKYLKE